MEKIGHKVKAAQYDTLEELISDLVLMFDNACRYNEPDSQIYKVSYLLIHSLDVIFHMFFFFFFFFLKLQDALTLQRVALQTKMQLCEDEGWVPDVRAAVQELMTTLFASVYNHQDEEGRCYTDSLAELAEHDEVDGKKYSSPNIHGIAFTFNYLTKKSFSQMQFPACFTHSLNMKLNGEFRYRMKILPRY